MRAFRSRSSRRFRAAVRRPAGSVIIDFTATPEREYIGFDVIDDLEAIANFYNNQGFLYGYFTETEDVDFDPLEKEKGHSLDAALVSFDWQDCHINLLDTPGAPDYLVKAVAALPAVETAVLEELRRLGQGLRRREPPAKPDLWWEA